MPIGDAGDDLSYEGDVSTSPVSLDYYREKAREFQSVLNSVDAAYAAANAALSLDIDPEFNSELEGFIATFETKRAQFKLAAEGINLGANVINSAGGRFPVLSLPSTLGIGPLAIPAAAIAGIGAAVLLASWAREWIAALSETMKRWQLLAAQDTPEKKAALAAEIARLDAAKSAAENSIWSTAGTVVKWVVVAGVAFLVYKAYQSSKGD